MSIRPKWEGKKKRNVASRRYSRTRIRKFEDKTEIKSQRIFKLPNLMYSKFAYT